MIDYCWHDPQAMLPETILAQLREIWELVGWTKNRVRSTEEWHEEIRSSRVVCFAFDDHKVVGFGRLIGSPMFPSLVDIVVHPDYQRRGIGRRIVQQLTDSACQETTPAAVCLFRWDGNEKDPDGNLAFYQEMGFEISHEGMCLVEGVLPE